MSGRAAPRWWRLVVGARRSFAQFRASGRRARRCRCWCCTRSACRPASTAAMRSSSSSRTGSTGTRIPYFGTMRGLQVSSPISWCGATAVLQFVSVRAAPGTPARLELARARELQRLLAGHRTEGWRASRSRRSAVRRAGDDRAGAGAAIRSCGRRARARRPGRTHDPGAGFDWPLLRQAACRTADWAFPSSASRCNAASG